MIRKMSIAGLLLLSAVAAGLLLAGLLLLDAAALK
jgi:hypothetical protein